MSQIDRYVLRQLGTSTLVVVLTLTGAVWLTQSLRFVDWIVNRGLPLATFGYITALALPNLLVVITPIALFAAVLFTYNKLQSDSELVVFRAIGCGPMRLIRPALLVALLVSLFSLLLNLYLLPASYRSFKDLQSEIRNRYSQILLQEGVFTNFDRGLTVFVREQSRSGDLQGIMVHDERKADVRVTMIAERGTLINGTDGPRIVMVNGNRQELNEKTGQLSFLFFERYTIDVDRAESQSSGGTRQRESTERYLGELLNASDVQEERVRANYRADGHQRLTAPLYPITFTLIALATLLSGSFSRRGQTLRIVLAVVLTVALQALGIGIANLASKTPALIPVMYLNAIIPALLALYAIAQPAVLMRRPNPVPKLA